MPGMSEFMDRPDSAICPATRAVAPIQVSIHDVSPDTLSEVDELLARLDGGGISGVLLLVIPGGDWQAVHLARLRGWVDAGHELAGHGWDHKIQKYGSLYHRIHGLLISRDVAEHLALSSEHIADLILRNFAWFEAHDLPAPAHYVPPAWAMGDIQRSRLSELPFQSYEYLRGIYYPAANRFVPYPLIGFEADTPFRKICLRGLNTWQRSRGRSSGRLRVAIHPHDLRLRLRNDLLDCMQGWVESSGPAPTCHSAVHSPTRE